MTQDLFKRAYLVGKEWIEFINPRPSETHAGILVERDKCPYEFRYFVYPVNWITEPDYVEVETNDNSQSDA